MDYNTRYIRIKTIEYSKLFTKNEHTALAGMNFFTGFAFSLHCNKPF
jgi:hypothetical protein